MAKPWEQYAESTPAAKPWEQYSSNDYTGDKLEITQPLSTSERFIKGLRDPLDASAQLLENITPEPIARKINQWSGLPEGGLNQQLSEQEAAYQARRDNDGVDFARMGGNVLSPMNLLLASKLPIGATATQKALAAIGGGAGINVATQPVTNQDSDFATEKAKQAGIGAVFGGFGQQLTSGIGRVISPKASVNPNVQLLKESGVTPTIGQALGGGFNRAEEALGSVPIVGSFVSGARTRANEQFQRGALNKALAPVGLVLPKGLQGRDALQFTENALKGQYDDTLNRIGAVIPDEKYAAKMANLESMVDSIRMPKDKKLEFYAVLDTIKQSRDANGVMTSQAYKDLESELGRVSSDLYGSKNIFDRRIAPAVKQAREELKNMLERQAGQDAKDLQNINKAWANFKPSQRAMASLGAEEGNFTPAQLLNAVKAGDRSLNKGAFARGGALGQEYAEAGKSVLGNKVRDSGTPERLLLTGAGLGAGVISPAAAAGLLGGSLAYSKLGQGLLSGAVTNRPEFAAPSAEFLRNSSKYLIPAYGSMAGGLLNQ